MSIAAPTLASCPTLESLSCTELLDIVERGMHASRAEWLFLRELRVGTGRRNNNAQRLDAFALNSLPHTGMKRVCYEVKTSRADFVGELKHPLKRRMGMRYSNEFYFLTPPELIRIDEVPVDCGLIEAGWATAHEWKRLMARHAGFFHYDPDSRTFCMITGRRPGATHPGQPGSCSRQSCGINAGNGKRSRRHRRSNSD